MAVQACVFNLWKLHTDVCLHALAISVGRSPGTFLKLGEKSAHEREKNIQTEKSLHQEPLT